MEGTKGWQEAGSTALVVPVPEADPLIGELRGRYTPSGREGMPSHATLLAPFVPVDRLSTADLARVTDIAGKSDRFAYDLASVARFPVAGVLYLAPEPASPFVALTKRVLAAFPDYPPYGRPAGEPVPHVTIASSLPNETLDELERRLAPELPIPAIASAIHLVERGRDGRWRLHTAFDLAARG